MIYLMLLISIDSLSEVQVLHSRCNELMCICASMSSSYLTDCMQGLPRRGSLMNQLDRTQEFDKTNSVCNLQNPRVDGSRRGIQPTLKISPAQTWGGYTLKIHKCIGTNLNPNSIVQEACNVPKHYWTLGLRQYLKV